MSISYCIFRGCFKYRPIKYSIDNIAADSNIYVIIRCEAEFWISLRVAKDHNIWAFLQSREIKDFWHKSSVSIGDNSNSSTVNGASEYLWYHTVKQCPDLNVDLVNSSIGQNTWLLLSDITLHVKNTLFPKGCHCYNLIIPRI